MFPQAFSGVYNLYTGITSMPVARRWDEARAKLAGDRAVAMITARRFLKSRRVSLPPGVEPVVERRVGHRLMVLLANRALLEKAAGARGNRRG